MQDWSFVCGHFWGEDDPFPKAFLGEGTMQSFPRGSYLQHQGGSASRVFLLTEGCVENSVLLEDGRRRVNLIYAGRVALGLSSLDEGGQGCGVTIRCLTPVKAAVAQRSRVLNWPPQLLLPLAMCQTQKLQVVYRQLRERYFLTAEDLLLLILGEMAGAGLPQRLNGARLRQTLLAEMLGISRVHLSTVLSKVKAENRMNPEQKAALSCFQEVGRDG